jgi:hypothetical protein
VDVSAPLEIASYGSRDPFFGTPYIDVDEWREAPLPHRRVHGGFAGTDTRFTFYFPTEEAGYQGRLFHPIEGAHAGHEDAFGGPMGDLMGGLAMIARLGGYMIESNSGHIGDDIDQKGGDDPTLYGHRAQAEAAHFSKHLAAQVYGTPPHHAYVWGGSGGGRRSPLCLEYAPDVYDGALPFMGGGDIDEKGTTVPTRGVQVMAFAAMFNVQRVLGPCLDDLIDRMQPGGSGNPYVGLSTHQRGELANLYRLGFPRGDEFMISQPMGQIWLWSSIADMLLEQDPEYFEAFWTESGYVGHDAPDLVAHDIIDLTTTVDRVVTARDLVSHPDYAGPEYTLTRVMAALMAGTDAGLDLPIAVEIKGIDSGYRLGAGLRMVSGKAKGRQLYCTGCVGDLFSADGRAEANILRFTDVEVGDEVHLDNRKFLAFCYYYRHHVMDDPAFDFLQVDGVPIYPQNAVPYMSPLMGVPYSGDYEGKLLWVHHTHDSSLWPPQGVVYERAVLQAQGAERAAERFRLRWTENAEHIPPAFLPNHPQRATATWLIDYMPVIEQSLVDLVAWVEEGTEPAGTNYQYDNGRVILPDTAEARGGIQPVLDVTANGSARADITAGEAVTLEVTAGAPPGAGTIIAVEWDFDGSGTFAFRHDVDGTDNDVKLATTHAYDRPGTYFATARAVSHRDGDVNAVHRRIVNVASARVVVTT